MNLTSYMQKNIFYSNLSYFICCLGPVVFPPSPPGDPSQTSGVVVGASGYGFVPPGSQGKTYGR